MPDTKTRPEIAIITTALGTTPFGRIGRALAAAFRDLGVRFDLIHLEGVAAGTSDGTSNIRGLGVRPMASVRPIAAYLRSARPKVTFVTPATVVPPSLIGGRLAGQVVVPWHEGFLDREITGLPLTDVKPRLSLLAQHATRGQAIAFAAVSRDIATHVALQRWHKGQPVHIVPNPVDSESIRRLALSTTISNEKRFTMVTSGRLTPSKGIDVLLHALALSADALPSKWLLLVLGDGPLGGQLRTLTRSLDLSRHVQFVGRVANPFPIMAAADVMVHPARWEGFGLVLTEALSLGLPILATSCDGGPHEILGDGRYGLLVAPDRPQALAAALVSIAWDEELRRRLSSTGPARADEYSPVTVASRLLDVARTLDPTVSHPVAPER